MLSFYLQQNIQCVLNGDGLSWQVIGLEVGSGLVQSHADIEVSFSDLELRWPEKREGDLTYRIRQEGRSTSQASSRGALTWDVLLPPGESQAPSCLWAGMSTLCRQRQGAPGTPTDRLASDGYEKGNLGGPDLHLYRALG